MIRPARRDDLDAWASMRSALWPTANPRELRTEIEGWFWSGDRDVHCIVAEEEGRLVGFIELSIRGYAEGCDTDRVGYVEGWYVAPGARRRHVGRALMRAGERWALARGCREFASDTEVTNTLSQAAHAACGFAEVERVVCFRKALRRSARADGRWQVADGRRQTTDH